jgi:integrase
MSLKLYKRPTGIFYIRGTVQDRRVDESAKTRVRAEAEAIKAHLESDLFKRAVYGDHAVATFSEAAEGYMLAGGERTFLTPLLLQFGNTRLNDLTQIEIDRYAAQFNLKPSSKVRTIYTPLTAVLNFGADNGLCAAPRIRKPQVKSGRTNYLTPAQAEAWIVTLPENVSALFVFCLATGCRISEALDLQWKDVTPEKHRVVFWETKSRRPRGVDLQVRARAVLPARADDEEAYVFLNSQGAPWAGYGGITMTFNRLKDKPQGAGLVRMNPHLLRHTWATWAYACTRDLTYLMAQGGWSKLDMLARYTHAASPDLARAVKAKGWEFFGREIAALNSAPAITQ